MILESGSSYPERPIRHLHAHDQRERYLNLDKYGSPEPAVNAAV